MAKVSKNIKHWVVVGDVRTTFMQALLASGLSKSKYFSSIQRIGEGRRFPSAQQAFDWLQEKELAKTLPRLSGSDRLLARYARERQQVINHYTNGKNICPQCGEGRIRALCIDHVNGDGASERKAIGSQLLYRKIIKAEFPPEYQVLCHNCNICKYHEKDRFLKK